ncbi:1-aminocyclopropane-1-carboxylate deaminase/D-cysteine desulfhydrase [Flavivirga rizhaonensis]|uniref:Pyridoxal-phosphate dependent enzyme n=1 Tax=Flavivirga rizhaonensis TaxID=2559571 RepID=A0A4S1E059_9FLAO|nr:pyridoxal-phosphate dependent enzyme [Flavivirga rizhaonensis]TGV03926.1 pyridoxal-phosphate dependent enzyme [Flavivirga rizhaonensis]
MIQKINEDLAIFRDDNYPFLGGGNKARKMMALHEKLKSENYNAIVTTGGIQSNHCRVTALYCHKYNIECTLVLHGDKDKFLTESGNAKIIRNTPTKIIFSEIDQISSNMDKAIDNYKSQEKKPFYLYGGGHTFEGGKAYIDVIQELIEYDYIPDYIFIASGTGSTHAGLLAGIAKFKFKTKVVGISVGRSKNNAEKVVSKFAKELSENYKISNGIGKTEVDDSFLCGGYGFYNDDIKKLSGNSLIDYNIFLDTTYTGKAFYGMKKYIENNAIKGKILFWYTGGIYNYLAK